MLNTDIGILRSVAGMISPATKDINPAVNTVHTLVAVNEGDGEWHAALFQNTPAAWHGRPSDAAGSTEERRDVMRRSLTCQSSHFNFS